jgi:hypothetical protein
MELLRLCKIALPEFRPILLLMAIAFSGTPCIRATEIKIPPLNLLLQALPDVTVIGGYSTDGANFYSSPPGPPQIFMGNKGTLSAADAFARPAIDIFPASTSTLAVTVAGPGQKSAAFAFAKAGSSISAAISVSGFITLHIDPFLVTDGTASATMAYDLFFNGEELFDSSASLEDGVLNTTGEFSPADFVVSHSANGSVTAFMTQTYFLVPFSIPESLINQSLPEEFDQSFCVSATNGGFAIASSAPEPSSAPLLGFGLAMLFIVASRKR